MGKLTLRSLVGHKLRAGLTSLAIVVGVTFMAGTFVLTDTLHNTFYALIGNIFQKIDFQVRGVAEFPTSDAATAVRNPLPASLVGVVRKVPGVEAADGVVTGYAQFVSKTGHPIETGAEPTLGESFDPDSRTSDLVVAQGHAPAGPHQVVMDVATADKFHFSVGQQVTVLSSAGPHVFTISGLVRYGTAGDLAGVTFAAFTLPRAQQLFDLQGKVDHINVVTQPGAGQAAVQARITRVLPRGVEVVSGKTVQQEQTSSIDQGLSFFSTALLIFAFIALFVGAFTIFNTFSITVGQRTRELALLRALGASRRQVASSVIAEAAMIGTASSAVGLGLGVLAAMGLEALMSGLGYALPSGPLVFLPRTAVVSVLVGLGVTVLSALGPARRALHVPPVAALSDRTQTTEVRLRRRLGLGLAIGLAGAALLAVGLTGAGVAVVGLGAACIFVGAAVLAPSVARPASAYIGLPLARLAGAPGRLGRQNSMRSPRRTAQTASALMVGIALVSAMSVFGASVSSSATSSIDDAIKAQLIVSSTPDGPGSFAPTLARRLTALPGVTSSLIAYGGQFEVRKSVESLVAASTKGLSKTVVLHMVSGTPDALSRGELLIDSSTASADKLAVGSVVPVKFALTGASKLKVGGIFKPNAVIGSFVVSQSFYLSHYRDPLPAAVLLGTKALAAVDHEASQLAAPYQTVQVQTRAQFEASAKASVNQLLTLVYALLALAVAVALIGVVNTLMLSVFERTREIGLLRAVGMRRRQVKAMVRCEAVVLAVFGAVMGAVIGAGLGVALVSSLSLSNLALPVGSLVIFVVVSAFLGLAAATWPARRAARLDVLAAIANQ